MAANLEFGKWLPKLESKLNSLDLEKLSRETGFVKRIALKANSVEFLMGFFIAMSVNCISYMNIAFCIGQLIDDTISKMAIKKRFTEGFVNLLQLILSLVLSDHLKSMPRVMDSDVFSTFKRVFLQDITTISLPAKLAKFFPGSGTNNGKKTATLKLQVVYEALRERFFHFGIGCFRDNDQKAAKDILSIAKAGDLVIRDLGYFVLEVFAKMIQQGIFLLSRLKYGVNIYVQNGIKQIDLVKLLKKYGQLDIDVTLGSKTKLPVRLIAIPLPDDVVNERRRKAKLNRDKRLNPDKNHLYLMGFNIFITNVDRETWSAKQVAQVYEIRWRIEIVFKAWKSYFKITNIPNASVNRVKANIYAMLIYITLFQIYCFIPLYHQLYEQQQKYLSLIKLTALMKLIQVFENEQSINKPFNENRFIQNILYHCAYEIRNDRQNYPQKIAC